jgi:hypothetical protein
MRQRKTLILVLALIIVAFLSYLAFVSRPTHSRLLSERDSRQDHADGQVRGERDAREDLAKGHYIQLEYGMPLPWNSEFDQCLGQYGIEVRNVGGDVFESGRDISTGIELSYYQSYNAISSAAIKQRFGPDVFERCMDTARKNWESSRQK